MYRVFIPFIHNEFTYNTVISKLEDSKLCIVNSLSLHEKKELQKNGSLKSLHHYYAFLQITPNISHIAGRNLEANLLCKKNTHLIHDNDSSKYWILKPYMTIEDRLSKGFNMLDSTTSNPFPSDFNVIAVSETNDEKEPEWNNEFANKKLDLGSFTHSSNNQTLEEELPKCLQFLTPSIMEEIAETARKRKAYFDHWREKEMIIRDYEKIEKELYQSLCFMQTTI